MLKRIFCKRRILIITDEEIKEYPLTAKIQSLLFMVVLFMFSWVFFASGKYLAYKNLAGEREEEVHKANLINIDLQARIDNLQGNLVRLNDYFNTVKEFDHNKSGSSKKIKRRNKKARGKKVSLKFIDLNNPFGDKRESRKRIDFAQKKSVLDSINENTVSRIDDLKKVISIAGLKVSDISFLKVKGESGLKFKEDNRRQGGPDVSNISKINSIDEVIDGDFYFSENIEELLHLENLFHSLPFSSPMKRYYISSRFGSRSDPMTRRKALHYGTDFAGPTGANVYSTAPGVIKFAGKKGNYGNFYRDRSWIWCYYSLWSFENDSY